MNYLMFICVAYTLYKAFQMFFEGSKIVFMKDFESSQISRNTIYKEYEKVALITGYMDLLGGLVGLFIGFALAFDLLTAEGFFFSFILFMTIPVLFVSYINRKYLG